MSEILEKLIEARKQGALKYCEMLDQYMPYWRERKKLLNDSTLDYLKGPTDL